ncbi:hypothetical protein COBT_003089 [Conglomerata obtusa]
MYLHCFFQKRIRFIDIFSFLESQKIFLLLLKCTYTDVIYSTNLEDMNKNATQNVAYNEVISLEFNQLNVHVSSENDIETFQNAIKFCPIGYVCSGNFIDGNNMCLCDACTQHTQKLEQTNNDNLNEQNNAKLHISNIHQRDSTKRKLCKEETHKLCTETKHISKKNKTNPLPTGNNHLDIKNDFTINTDLISKSSKYTETNNLIGSLPKNAHTKSYLKNFLIRKNLNEKEFICEDYSIVFDVIVSNTHDAKLIDMYDRLKKNQIIDTDDLKVLNEIFSNDVALIWDPFYAWKNLHSVNLGNLLFDCNQRSDDKIYKKINNYEKIVIGKLLNKDYINIFTTYKEVICHANDIIESFIYYKNKEITNSVVIAASNIAITKSRNFLDACKNYLKEVERRSEIVDFEFIRYYTYVSDILTKSVVYTNFAFDSLFSVARSFFMKSQLKSCTIQLIYLKNILVECLDDASIDFITFFPEVDVLIDYLKKNTEYDLYVLKNQCLYTFLFMANVLADIAKYKWHDVYSNPDIDENDSIYSIYKCSAFFSIKKYEIFRVISYCIIPFVDTQRYNYYVQARTHEKLSLYIDTTKPFSLKSTRFNAFFVIASFNFIARFLFLYDINLKDIFTCSTKNSDSELINLFLLHSFKKSVFINILISNLIKTNVVGIMKSFINTIKKKDQYQEFISQVEKLEVQNYQYLINKNVTFKCKLTASKHKDLLSNEINKLKSTIKNVIIELLNVEKHNIDIAIGAMTK